MGNLDGFDANEHEPNTGFEPVPAGEYVAVMTDSEFKPTKAGTGEYLECKWQVIEGEHKGSIVFDRLNLKNPNDTAVKIACGTLSAICHAVGVLKPKDSEELHGKPVLMKVALREREDKPGEYSNDVKSYKPVDGKSGKAESKSDGDSSRPPWKK